MIVPRRVLRDLRKSERALRLEQVVIPPPKRPPPPPRAPPRDDLSIQIPGARVSGHSDGAVRFALALLGRPAPAKETSDA